MTIVILLFVWIITASMTPFAQFKISYSVQEVFNEKIIVHRFKFLFRGISGAEVDTDGIIKPMFIMHIIGYLATFILIITSIVMFVVIDADPQTKIRLIILINFLGMFLIAILLILIILYARIVDRKNNKKV